MRIATVHLESVSPYSQSAVITEPKNPKENSADYEKRTWRFRANADEKGNIIIPPMAFKNCIEDTARFLSERIPGKGQATYTKHFTAGILVFDPLVLPEKRDTVRGEWFFVPSDGKRGGGKRVMKCFPVIPSWKGKVDFMVLDSVITKEVFENTIREAGNFVGLGRFRPARGGFYGRFKVNKVEWSEK
jgi:hypothetical protein